MNDLIRYGQVMRGWLGVQVEQLPASAALEGTRLLVRAVAPGGPAERAGLRAGDVITHFNDEAIDDVRLVMYEISLLRPGDRLLMSVARESGSEDLTAIVGTQPEEQINPP
jgi:serine protease DegS